MGAPNQQASQGTFNLDDTIALFQQRKRVIVSASATLTVAQSGSLCTWPAATGFTYTLPAITAADLGTWFEFVCPITNTTTACKVITASASVFMTGSPLTYINNTTPGANPGPKGFLYDPAASVACVMGGTDTTAGGIAGTRIRLTAVSTTLWFIEGQIIAAGTIVTSASAS